MIRPQNEEHYAYLTAAAYAGARMDSCAENYKRRRAATAFERWETESKLFFERLLLMKKEKETVFIRRMKAKAKAS